MPSPIDERYKAHVLNLRALESAHTQIARQLNFAVAAEQSAAIKALLKTYILLIGAWAEVRLLKLLHEPAAFSEDERAKVFACQNQLTMWKMTLEIGLRRRYAVGVGALSIQNVPATAFLRYRELDRLLDEDLEPVIGIRNKLAHGQWERTFTNSLDEISHEMMTLLNGENALSCKFKKSIIEYISRIIHDLAVGGVAFERDFDEHYRFITIYQNQLTSRSYTKWEKQQVSKLKRGRARSLMQ